MNLLGKYTYLNNKKQKSIIKKIKQKKSFNSKKLDFI